MNPKDVPAGVMDHMLMHLFSRVSCSTWKKPVDCSKIIIGYLDSPIGLSAVTFSRVKFVPNSPFTMIPEGYAKYVRTALERLKEAEKL